MAETLEISKPKQKRLEDYLLERSQATAGPTIGQRAPNATAPLTFAQEQVWLHAQLAPDTPAYNEPFTIHRHGPLDVSALQRAFTEIIRRHEAWRTSFNVVDGQPVQMVHPPFEFKLPVKDFSALPETDAKAAALQLATEDARRPFDLSAGPPIRAQLARVGKEEYRLFVNCHHLIFDGVTAYQVFLPELVALYEAFFKGQADPLPALPFQYADYAIWQRESSRSASQEQKIAYWKDKLSGPVPVLQLPVDRPQASVESFRGAMQTFAIPSEVTDGLRALSRQYGATLFMTVLAALNALLSRYSGQDDILIGSVTAGRNYPGSDKLLGFFLNTIVLRNDLAGDPTFKELLERVRKTTIDALSHGDMPLNQVVKELHPDRELTRNPLFRVLLSMEPSFTNVYPGWDLTPIEVETGTAKFDLCVVLDERPNGISGRMIYSTDLFDESTISRMVECWLTLLGAVVANPDQRLSEISILAGAERQKLLEWNATQKRFPFIPVHQQFENAAQKTPTAIALKCGAGALGYAELNQRAEHLASYLQRLGVGPEIPVGLCMERSLEMIVGILGILKAGGAYVPMDPTYPTERLAFMLTDSQAPVLLTQAKLPSIAAANNIRIVKLDADWKEIAAVPQKQPEDVECGDLAYIIYTSGSTGEPKGVEVTHGNLGHSNSARLDFYGDTDGTYLLLSSIGFDSSVATIFHALCSGGTLVLLPAEQNIEARQIAELILREKVSSVLCVPSLYNEVLNTVSPEMLKSLRRVILAGEASTAQLVDHHSQVLPGVELFNEYGPTEGSVWSTVYKFGRALQKENAVPIGRPIANTRAYVLDRYLQLLPPGVAGELFIAGDGVARGYRNKPGLTLEKFLPDPFAASPGERIYRTGDVVRYNAEGDLHFLGRVDEQIKFRGLRIELGEIETILSAHPDVREAVVTVQEASQKPRLIAHVVVTEKYATSAAELRAFLKARLPNYMVPSGFVFMEKLPRIPNGKIDRPALAKQTAVTNESNMTRAAIAQDSIETKLITIWKNILAIQSAEVAQDFFELGGDSLLAAKLLYEIEQEFHQSLPLAFVFQAPTVEMMADALRSPDQSLRARAIVEIQPNGSHPPLFCIRAGPRFRLLAQKLGMDQPFLGVDIPYSDAIKLPTPYRIEDMAKFMVKAMREVQPHGPYYIAGLCVNAVIAYEVARQLQSEGEPIALLAMFDGHNGAYYKNPLRDGRYTGRIKYHVANLLKLDLKESSAYVFHRLEEARRKVERTMWLLTAEGGTDRGGKLRNTDSIIHPAYHRFEPSAYTGDIVLFQSSDWPEGGYFNFEIGWKDLIKGKIEFHRIPGNHPSMFREPNVNVLASGLQKHLKTPKEAGVNGTNTAESTKPPAK